MNLLNNLSQNNKITLMLHVKNLRRLCASLCSCFNPNKKTESLCSFLTEMINVSDLFYRMPENEVNTLSSKLSKFSSLGSKHRYRLETCCSYLHNESLIQKCITLHMLKWLFKCVQWYFICLKSNKLYSWAFYLQNID